LDQRRPAADPRTARRLAAGFAAPGKILFLVTLGGKEGPHYAQEVSVALTPEFMALLE
jgi:hypothetical protein